MSHRATAPLAAAERLLSQYKAIVLPLVTQQGATLLIVVRRANGASVIATAIKGLDLAALNRFLSGAEPSGRAGGWFGAYAINHLPSDQQVARRSEWLAAIESLPSKLSELVGAALADALRANGVARNDAVLWLPQGALGLLPVAIASGGTARAALIDDYAFSTAPSLAAAEASLRRARAPAGRPTLTAVVNPTGDLAFTEPEGAVAASHFEAARRSLFGAEDARSERVLAALAKSNHWHFATHGTFSWVNAGRVGANACGQRSPHDPQPSRSCRPGASPPRHPLGM